MEKNNKIKGGKADKLSLEDIARKHNVFIGTIKKELDMGMKVEKEHTDSNEMAKEIATDHLAEFPDYYTRLAKMEKTGKKTTETKESMGADSSGSYEASLSSPITRPIGKVFEVKKKDIPNWKSKQIEAKEQMDAGVSAGAMYDGPIGTAGPSSPMDKTKKKRKDPLKIDNAESIQGASITGPSTKDMISTKKGFPRFGGPDAKFVTINDKCKKMPYCDQGASSDKAFKGRPNPIKLTEILELKQAIHEASKKYGIPIEQVKKMVVEALPAGIDFGPASTWGNRGKENNTKFLYRLTTTDPIDFETKDETEFMKLKLMLSKNNTKFHEEKRPLTKDESNPQVTNQPEDEDDDDIFDDQGDIFANMK